MLVHTISNVIEGFIIARPSKIIKSPYVADVKIGGDTYLAHCPSLGLCGMIKPGSLVFMTENQNNTKTHYKIHCVLVTEEYANTEFTTTSEVFVGCDPILSNKIGEKLFLNNFVPYFSDFDTHKREYKWGNSRFDHYFRKDNKDFLVEIKSVPTCDFYIDNDNLEKLSNKNYKKLVEDNIVDIYKNRCYQTVSKELYKRRATFPDGYKKTKNATVSERANKHLTELQEAASSENTEAYLILFVMRNDCYSFQPAWQVDPLYNKIFNEAIDNGVKIKVLKFRWEFKNQELNIYYENELKIDQKY